MEWGGLTPLSAPQKGTQNFEGVFSKGLSPKLFSPLRAAMCTHLTHILHAAKCLGVYHDMAFTREQDIQLRDTQVGTAFCSVGERPTREGVSAAQLPAS